MLIEYNGETEEEFVRKHNINRTVPKDYTIRPPFGRILCDEIPGWMGDVYYGWFPEKVGLLSEKLGFSEEE